VTAITFNGCSYFFEYCGDSAFCIETVENPTLLTCHGLTSCGNGPTCDSTSDCDAGYDCVPYCGSGKAGFCLAQCDVSSYDDDANDDVYDYVNFGGDMCWAPGYTYFLEEMIALTSEGMQNTYSSYIASKSSRSSSADLTADASGTFLTSRVVMGGSVLLVAAGAVLAVAITIFNSKNGPSFQSLPDSSEDVTATTTTTATYMLNDGVELETMPSSRAKAVCQL
jgi:hypothetical protein